MMIRFNRLFIALSLPFASSAYANLAQQLDAARQQQQQQYQQAQAERLRPQADVRLDTSVAETQALANNETPCYPISRITLIDYDSAEPHSQFQWALESAQQALHLQLPHCFGGEGLGQLMKQIQNEIIGKGYVTTRVVAQEQNLQGGHLVLTVIGGKVRNTVIADSSPVPRFTRLHALTGLTFKQGKLLNIRDVEQSLENLKRLPTVDANIEILPSADPQAMVGESDLKISYRQAFPFRLNLGLDDAGSKATGRWQGSATLSVDNLFSANDLFYATFTRSFKQKGDDHGDRASQNLSLYYAIPFGYWQLAFSHQQSRYRQEVFGAFDNSYIYSGESDTDKLTLSYLLYRNARHKTSISGSFWSRQSQNYIDHAEIEVQKRRMAGWEAGLSHKAYFPSATLEFNAQFKRGTAARGALSAPEEGFGEGTSRPKIITASVSLSKPFLLGKQQWQWQSSFNAQWNKTPLIAQDRFSIGGRYTVRGSDGELTLSGEKGWTWRNDLSWHINHTGHSLYIALDSGRIAGNAAEQLGKTLVGGSLGLKGNIANLNYDLFIGKPLHKPKGFKTSNTVAGLSLSVNF